MIPDTHASSFFLLSIHPFEEARLMEFEPDTIIVTFTLV